VKGRAFYRKGGWEVNKIKVYKNRVINKMFANCD